MKNVIKVIQQMWKDADSDTPAAIGFGMKTFNQPWIVVLLIAVGTGIFSAVQFMVTREVYPLLVTICLISFFIFSCITVFMMSELYPVKEDENVDDLVESLRKSNSRDKNFVLAEKLLARKNVSNETLKLIISKTPPSTKVNNDAIERLVK